MSHTNSAKRVRTGVLDAKLLAILGKQVRISPSQRLRALKAGFSVGVITHSPVGTKKSVPYQHFYMRRGQFERFITSPKPKHGRTRRARRMI
jgi:hypothetical protein